MVKGTGNTLNVTGGVNSTASKRHSQSKHLPDHLSAVHGGNTAEASVSRDMDADGKHLDPGEKWPPLPARSFRAQPRVREFPEGKMHFLTLPPTGQKHAVSLLWPRDDEGKAITQATKESGKRCRDDYAWGETRHDFFKVKMAPGINPDETSVMTSSQLLRTMGRFGELQTAKHEIKWAKSEGEPMLQNVVSMQAILETLQPKVTEYKETRDGYMPARIGDVAITSPSHPSHSPPPRPLIPFETTHPELRIQERLPHYLLPQTLHVHDQYNLLSAYNRSDGEAWDFSSDVVHTYTLDLREKALTELASGLVKAEEREELRARTTIILRYTQTAEQVQSQEPIIEIVLPPCPRRPTKVDEGHLYLSPFGKVGRGHHSVVYKAEWELPRDLFARPVVCGRCLRERVQKEVQRLKVTGEWDNLLRASGVVSVGTPHEVKKDEREIICVVSPTVPPMEILEMIDENDVWSHLLCNKEKTSIVLPFTEGDNADATGFGSPPIIRINPTVSYQDASFPHTVCSHNPAPCPVLRTARFTVIAKLALKQDGHLEAEARNYQRFPDYFFEHWSEYAYLPRLDRILQLGKIVPQFYGYYTLKDGVTQGKPAYKPFCSPILLVEHCGEPIEPSSLSIEEQEECASLFVRFHHAGWLHKSVHHRNVVVQDWHPGEGESSRDASFRLIDFGRSTEFERDKERNKEDRAVHKLLTKLL